VLSKKSGFPRVEYDSSDRTKIVHKSFSITINDDFFDVKRRLKYMNKFKIDMQVLSLPNPWFDFLKPQEAANLVREVNDEISSIVERYPDRFIGLASLQFLDIEKSLDELDRAIGTLGLKGLIIGSNVQGRYIDHPRFWPIFDRAEKMRIPIFVHPTTPAETGTMIQGYALVPLIGFIFDTTLAISRLIFSGTLEKHPHLRFISAHLAGAIPYLIGRLNVGYKAFSDCSINIKDLPNKYLRNLYADVISYHEPALLCAYATLGADKLLFGTDYPFPTGNSSPIIKSVERINLSEEEKNKIFYKNTLELLSLKE